MKKLVFLAALAALTLTAPATAGAASFKGVVVAKNAKRHTLAVASSTGVVRTVRTTKLGAAIGNRVAVSAKALRDGTFSASNVAIRGKAHHARIHGVVARRLRGGLLISAGHSMVLVKTGRRTAAAGGGQEPKPGDVVNANVTVTNNGELDDDNVENSGHTDKVELDGTLSALNAPTASAAGSLTVKVGDLSFDVVVPAGFNLPSSLKVGDRVQLKASVSGSTMTLLKLEGDNNNDNNDDNNDDGDNNDNNDNGGDNGGGNGD